MLIVWIAALLLSLGDTPAITPENVAEIEVINRLAIIGTYAEELAFDPVNSRELALAQSDGLVSIWDVTTGEGTAEWRAAETSLNAITYTSDGTQIITAADDGNVKVWDAVTYELVMTLNLVDQIPVVLGTAPNSIIVVGYRDGNVRLWDTNTGTSVLTLYGYNIEMQALAVSLDGSRVAFGYYGTVLLYHLENIARQQVYIEAIFDAGELRDLAFHPNPPFPPFWQNSVLATAGSHAGTELWALPFATIQHSWSTESTMAYPQSLSLNQEGSLLAIAGKATTAGGGCNINPCPIEIIGMPFDPNGSESDMQVLVTLVEHQAWPVDVTFSSDSRYLVSADNLGLILIWGIPP